jgi:hypothetical protein
MVTFDETETTATWTVTVNGLSRNMSNAHIHLGKPGHAGGRAIILLGGFPQATSGTWTARSRAPRPRSAKASRGRRSST